MVLGKMKKAFKKALTITLAAAMVATSVPQLAVQSSAQERILDAEQDSTEEVVQGEEGMEEAVTDKADAGKDVSGNDSGEGDNNEETKNMALRYVAAAVTDGNWANVISADITGFSDIEDLESEYIVSYDIYLPKDADFTGSYYIKPALKLNDGKGNEYNWVDGGDTNAATITKDSFSSDESSGLLKYSFSGKVTVATEAYTGITCVALLVGSDSCSYNGAVFIDNVAVSNETGNIKVQDFTNYEGAVELGNMEGISTGENGGKDDDEVGEAPAFDQAVLVFDTAKDAVWKDKVFATNDAENYPDAARITDIAVKTKVKLTATVTAEGNLTGLDGAEAEDSSYNAVQLACAIKTGSGWDYNKSGDYPFLKAENFEGGKAQISFNFSDVKAGALEEIDFQYNANSAYSGKLTISEVKIYNVEEKDEELEEKAPQVLSDLSTEADYQKWTTEGGWDYHHGDAEGTKQASPVIGYDNENQRLKVSLDYSADSASTWSEAKVKFVPGEGVDVSQYNQLSVDFIYPDELDGTKMKFFADGIMNVDTAVDESTAETLADGMKKVTVTMSFSPTATPLESVTIGIIGVSTSFKGDVYLDNLVVSQKNVAEDFVKITAQAGAGSAAKIENVPESIKVSDAEADVNAKALFTYLKTLANNDQVLFGHQNDVNKQVNASAAKGDVYDITGQVSGLFGIDTLSLTGSEAGGTDAATALANSVAYSKMAAENGAIVTLSAHMPNVSNSKVVKNEDGTYDFFQCDFNESKDLSNEIAKKILPGGEYNVVYNAYLDIIVNYAAQLQEAGIPIIFRPLHENTGNWFWWGASNTAETYKSLYRYTKDYIEGKGVHNMLWVYSPNGPLTSEAEYLSYYPGDEYVDILAFDYYDDYNTYPAVSDDSFFKNMDETCKVVAALAEKRGKIAAISECGVRVMKKDGSDNEGLLVKGNPVGTQASGKNWYSEINKIAQQNDMPYFLVWANFSDTNFYVPYKYNDTYGHELINDFIDFYNEESSVFGADTHFYENKEKLAAATVEKYTNPMGYMVYPFDGDTILEAAQLKAVVENAKTVQFVITDANVTENTVTIDAAAKTGNSSLWIADLTDEAMEKVGKTEVASILLKADGVELAKLTNISLGKEKEKAPANVIENFDYYSGSNGLLDASYTANSAAGCSSAFVLDTENKADGTYGGAFHYKLTTTGSEVWTGRIKTELVSGDFSAYNALEMWVKPDGKGQKLVVQLTDASGEEFEVYLTNFVKGTEAQYITIPFSSFKGKKNGTLDTANITKFAIWCNSIVPEGHEGTWEVESTIYFDGIQAVKIADNYETDEDGLIIKDKSLDGLWIQFVNGKEYSYTGKAVKPEIKVYDGAELLVEKTDYTVTYKNNVKVGEAAVIVKGKGNYTDKTEAAFTIHKKDLGDADVTAEDVAVIMNEDGTIPASKVVVKIGKTTLKEGANKDYMVERPVVTAEGRYEITIKAAENSSKYTGSRKIAYVVLDSSTVLMNKVTVKLDKAKVDYGKANPVVTEVYSGSGKKKVTYTEGTDYKVVYPETQIVGKNNAITIEAVEGGKLYGTKKATFMVNGIKLKATAALEKENWSYTGEQIKPSVTEVKDKSGNVLAADKDYVVTYDKNINQGKGKVIITGCGAYTGTITKIFKIEKVDLNTLKDTVVIAKKAAYSKAGAKPGVVITFNGKTLVEKQDYTVSYKNNKKVGDTVKVTITGKGNFAGKVVNEEAKVVVSSKDNVTFTAGDVCINAKSKINNIKPKLTIVETNTNKKLTAKADYDNAIKYYSDEACTTEITAADIKADKVLYAQVSLTGNYGSTTEQPVKMTAAFRLYTAKASSFKVDMPTDVAYTGNAVEPKLTVTVKEGKTTKTLVEGEDYSVTYTDNVKVGTAKAVVLGIGNGYGGSKTVNFKIKPQKLSASVFSILTDSVRELLAK